MTRSQVDRLGERLREGGQTDELLLEQLQHFRAEFAAPLARAHEIVAAALGLQPTGRIKTINTIVEKLVRSKTRLSTMQDVAGVRVVVDSDLRGQDDAVQALRSAFKEARVDDLRRQPHFGYRAVHVVPLVEGRSVEIQIRTALQDLWAQGMELLADKVGRGIRYGEAASLERVSGISVAELVSNALEWADHVRVAETVALDARALGELIQRSGGVSEEQERLAEAHLRMTELSRTLKETVLELHAGLGWFIRVVERL